MRLPRPFFQLPLLFDAARLQAEVAALPPDAWTQLAAPAVGNSVVDLISPQMMPTRWLEQLPYMAQILAGLGVVWSRSQLMRLAPGASVPEHADIDYHWHSRVQVQIPMLSLPDVRFHCGGDSVHMAAGEAWIFDNGRRYRVNNDAAQPCIHLVADTSGTAAFWQLAFGPGVQNKQWRTVTFQPERKAQPLTERNEHPPVMSAAEVQWLIDDFCAELKSSVDSAELRERSVRLGMLLDGFIHDWRQLCALHGTLGRGLPEFRRLASSVLSAAKPLAEGLTMRSNGVRALQVLEARILKHLVKNAVEPGVTGGNEKLLERPVFIVGAPRSGSTLLFETLACSPTFNTLGGEAHWLIESVESLRPGAPGVESNRLDAVQATDEVAGNIRQAALVQLQGPEGRAPSGSGRFLEKTPKNSLRISFLRQVFPDARFIFLWRDPRENLSSIMEAWRSGNWITYSALPGWDGPWSLLLPPGWPSLRSASLETIAARQWQSANEIALDDLALLPAEHWTSVAYHDFLADPSATVRRLCDFTGVAFDSVLQERTARSLPQSRSTHTPPAPDKWRRNEADINRVMASITPCWERLQALQ